MGKGRQTKHTILDTALREASQLGLQGLAIGPLARTVGMSKSGLFAHFGSKEDLQVAVVEHAAELFTQRVILPALASPRGEPRLRALMQNWMAWADSPPVPGGCLITSGSFEYDSRPGAVRDTLHDKVRQLRQTLTRAAQIAIDEGHFKDTVDPAQLAFEAHAIILAHQVDLHLLGAADAAQRSLKSLDTILNAAKH